jgi:hypothetical protein
MATTYDLDAVPVAPISSHQGAEVDLLASTLHHVLQGITHSDHPQDDKHTGIDLVVDSDVLALKGNGAEVNPALLSGQIVLDLAESTTVKQITLQFRGKAKLPPVENEPWVSSPFNASHEANKCSEFLASSVFYTGSVSVTRR